MIYITTALISFELPKYYLFIIINLAFYLVKNRKNLILNVRKGLFFKCILIYFSNYFIIANYGFNSVLTIGWPLAFTTFYFIIAHDYKFLTIKNFILILKILFFSTSLTVIFIYLSNIYINYPILRNGLIHQNSIFKILYNNGFNNDLINYNELIVERVGISYLYLKLYLITIFSSALALLKNQIRFNWYLILPIVLVIGLTYGSRSFVIFYFFSVFFVTFINKNFIHYFVLFTSLLIFFFNINFFKNETSIKYYLKLFNLDINKVTQINQSTKNNKKKYSFSDLESFQNTTVRLSQTKPSEALNSRVYDNIYGFYAILKLNKPSELENFFRRTYPDGYFLSQKFFHNTYLNFFYLGGFYSFIILLGMNIHYFFNILKNRKNNKSFYALIYAFIGIQFICSIETPYLTTKSFYFIFLLFYLFSNNISIRK